MIRGWDRQVKMRIEALWHHGWRNPVSKVSQRVASELKQEKLELACDTLTHFAHWITPPMMPKRFDTHFYLAIPPADHIAVHDGYESVDSVWIDPKDAVKGAEDGTYTIIFPTLRNIEKLATWST